MDEYKHKQSRSNTGAIMRLRDRKRQATLDVSRLLKQDQEKMTRLVTMVLYKTGHPRKEAKY